ncbi:MAG: polyphosphate polymerase domain-containing protein [Deltaproteobacteria bacterium]|nr:polyphosphate polymerase domain-containing protein [Deltaproteobacteria bacterium]
MLGNTWERIERPLSKPLDQLSAIAHELPEVSSELLERRALLRRTDSKFLVPVTELAEIVDGLGEDYGALKAGEAVLATYRTRYFDTPELRCFHDHRRGVRPRHKVRIRHYPDRQLSFLEVKTKRSSALTHKYRYQKPYQTGELGTDDREFVRAHANLDVDRLQPQAWTNFRRLSLVGLEANERVTIDVELELEADGQTTDLDELAVIEVKQAPFCVRTPVMQRLREHGLRPVSNSKYVTAIALGRPEVRTSRLAPNLRILEQLR